MMHVGPGISAQEPYEYASKTSRLNIRFKLAVALSTAAFLITLLQDFAAEGTTPSGCHSSMPQGTRLPAPRDDFGCAGENCWAGVYVDSATKEVLHLARGGRAFFSPGTAAGTRGDIFWRKATEDRLGVVDSHGQPVKWPGTASDLRRDPVQAGKLAGFGAEMDTTNGGPRRVETINLVRDPLGFVFPGCIYVLSLLSKSPLMANAGHEYRVLVHEDGTVTDIVDGGRIARWSFPRAPLVGNDEWATGDELLLVFESTFHHLLRGVAAEDMEVGRGLELSSPDGGRTWLPMTKRGPSEEEALPEARAPLLRTKDCVVLALVLPAAVSLFPLTSAMRPIARYLNGGEAENLLLEDNISIGTDGTRLQPLFVVFEAQPFFSGADHDQGSEYFKGVIVISRAIPRPSKKTTDLSCVINGVQTRATWLSWSMMLCSMAHVKREEVVLYVAFGGRRISLEISYRHALPPRHLRLAWPDAETFDIFLPKLVQGRRTSVSPFTWSNGTTPGVAKEGALGTTMAVCTMFKNEAPYLEEWLQYHRLLGVSKVFLYDNGSSDRSREILRKFELSQFVEVRHWPHDGAQTEALNDCLCRFRHTTRWMTFIDVDEFVDPAPTLTVTTAGNFGQGRVSQLHGLHTDFDVNSMAARRKLLLYLLEAWAPRRHTHCMAWVNYCSYGQLSKSTGAVTDTFRQLEDMGERKIHMQKPLFKALEALTLRKIGPHFLLYATEDIDEQYRRNLRCPYEWLDPAEFRVRHYRSKSLEEYVQRRAGADSAYTGKQYTREQLALEWKETNSHCGKEGTTPKREK